MNTQLLSIEPILPSAVNTQSYYPSIRAKDRLAGPENTAELTNVE